MREPIAHKESGDGKPRLELLRRAGRPYLSLIYAGKQLGELAKDIKYEDPRIINYVLSQLPKSSTALIGRLFPKDINGLGKPIPTTCSEELETELLWSWQVFQRFLPQLCDFIDSRGIIQNAVLENDLNQADLHLNALEQRLGVSWWSIENKLLVAQRRNGLEANRGLLRQYHAQGKSSWVKWLANFCSQRVEDGISAEEYDEVCNIFTLSADVPLSRRRIWAYLRLRHNFQKFVDDEYLPFCLNIEESHSLIDRFITFSRVLHRYLATNEISKHSVIASLIHSVAAAVPDRRLRVMSSLLDPQRMEDDSFSAELFQILHDYTLGDYTKVSCTALVSAAQHADVFEFYEIAVKAALRAKLQLNNPFTVGTFPSRILESVFHVLARDSDTGNSLRTIQKLAYQLDSTSLSDALFAFFRRNSEDQQSMAGDRFGIFASAAPTPRLVISIERNGDALEYLGELSIRYPNNAAIDLFLATRRSLILNRTLLPSQSLPESRLCKYRAYVSESLSLFSEALAAYEELDELAHANPMLKTDATTGQYRCSLHLGRVLECATILANAASVNPNLLAKNTLKSVLDKYKQSSDSNWLKNIAWPVLHCLGQHERHTETNTDVLHDVLDDFLCAWGCQRPSQLSQFSNVFPDAALVYLLRFLCIPEVLDSSIWYDNQDDVELERIRVCEWLSEIDAEHQDIYTAEVAELTSRATVRALTHEVGQSKIFVDTEGVKSALPTSFRDRIRRCAAFAQIAEDLRQGVQIDGLVEDKLKTFNVTATDEGVKLFKLLFNEIKQGFISSNEYGLDSNLSQRIRHGTVSGAIRAHFETSELVTRKNEVGNYIENMHWLNKLEVRDEMEYKAVNQALSLLSAKVDALADEVRNKWIQIKAVANDNQGMFDYDFTDQELTGFFDHLIKVPTADAFIDGVIDKLWQRTENDLERIRTAIDHRLKLQLFGFLDECQSSLESAISGSRTGLFRATVTNCKTQLEYGMQSLAAWFYVDRVQRIPSFKLSVLISALLEQVAKYCKPSQLVLRREFKSDRLLHGRLFRPLWDLLFILLDNIAKHSGLETVPVTLEVKQDDAELSIKVSNELGPSVDRDAVRLKIARAEQTFYNGARELLKKEGGSGWQKIYKIVKYQLHCAALHELRLGIGDDDLFTAIVTLPAKGFYDENLDN